MGMHYPTSARARGRSGGFEAVFSPEVQPYNGLSNARVFAEAMTKIKVGTWIANVYVRGGHT